MTNNGVQWRTLRLTDFVGATFAGMVDDAGPMADRAKVRQAIEDQLLQAAMSFEPKRKEDWGTSEAAQASQNQLMMLIGGMPQLPEKKNSEEEGS